MPGEKRRHIVIAAGVGGSGVISVGTLIAQAGLRSYEYVTRFPNYTRLMRLGPCECIVILSNDPILSPLVARGDVLLIVNNSQLKAFEERVLPGGIIILESTGPAKVKRKDVRLVEIPAVEIATSMSSPLMANMILLGAYLQISGVFPNKVMEEELKARFGSAGKETVLAQNRDAFRKGVELAKNATAKQT